MEMRFCHSCSMPLTGSDGTTVAGNYCQYCSDESGNLKTREEVKQGIAEWLGSWSPGVDSAECLRRAEHYMQAMPAWQ